MLGSLPFAPKPRLWRAAFVVVFRFAVACFPYLLDKKCKEAAVSAINRWVFR